MNEEIYSKTGIYIAYPTSPVLKSIYKAGNYKTMVNDQHTKVGKAERSFSDRRDEYFSNFGSEAEFIPIAIIEREHVVVAEELIKHAIKIEFSRIGYAHEWFDTVDRDRIREIVIYTLATSEIEYEIIQSLE